MYNASQNLTLNELINHKRYAYLKDKRGAFQNPFYKGIVENFRYFFHPKPVSVEHDFLFSDLTSVYTV